MANTTHRASNPAMRYKNWMVTAFDLENFAVPDTDPNFKYMVYQVETAPETGRDHIQGYLELHRQTDFGVVKRMFSVPVHLESRRGTRAQAIAYCKKLDTRYRCPVTGVQPEPLEFGSLENNQGAREDLKEAHTKILGHATWQGVIRDPDLIHIVARHLNWAREVFNSKDLLVPQVPITLRKWQLGVVALLEQQPVNRRIIWIWSALSGTGKTTFFNYCSAKYSVLPGADWTNTIYLYNGHSIVWFDRTRAESVSERSVSQFYVDIERWSNHSIQTSTKYQPVRKFVQCHCVVTANVRPDDTNLPGRFYVVEAKLPEDEAPDSPDLMDVSDDE